MRVVLQRALSARAEQDGVEVAAIGCGLALFVGFALEDTDEVVTRMASKVAHLRVFDDGERQFGRSLLDVGGEALTLSQYTVLGRTSRGRRPDFSRRAPTAAARALYATFGAQLLALGVPTVQGPFQARLVVDVRGWGPFTLQLDSER